MHKSSAAGVLGEERILGWGRDVKCNDCDVEAVWWVEWASYNYPPGKKEVTRVKKVRVYYCRLHGKEFSKV